MIWLCKDCIVEWMDLVRVSSQEKEGYYKANVWKMQMSDESMEDGT